MRSALVVVMLVTGCTIGAGVRVEATYDFDGSLHARGDLVGAVGITAVEAVNDVAHARANFALMSIGGGWGGHEGVYLTVALEYTGVPGEGGGVGFSAGFRTRVSTRCLVWTFKAGAAGLLAQTQADDGADDPVGPNPTLTRYYHDLAGVIGYTMCDGEGERFLAGAAYEVGVGKLVFNPGP
jgi:hypothetical protein